MSFAYMPMFTGDYLRDTRHLTPLKHGIYLLLLMHCWDQKGPVPLDEQECAGIANCRSSDEIESLRYILNRYFVRMDDGWYNPRMQKEIERSETISHARSEAGKRGYQAKAKQLPDKSKTVAEQVPLTPSPSLTPSSTPDQKAKRAKAFARPSHVNEQVWNDFLKTRAKHRAEVTDTAMRGIQEQADRAGISLEDALRIVCIKGWRSFDAGWNWRSEYAKLNPEDTAQEALRLLEARDGKA